MATQYIEKFADIARVPGNNSHAGIGQVGNALFVRVDGNLVSLTPGVPRGSVFYVDANSGDDANSGLSWGEAFATIGKANTEATSGAGDVIVIGPGPHNIDTLITVSKNNLSFVGAGEPQSFFGGTGTSRIRVNTAGIAGLFNIAAHYVSFYNISLTSGAASTNTVYDLKLSAGAQNFYAEGCSFTGGGNTTQTTDSLAGVPILFDGDESFSGNNAKFVGCRIGSPSNATRTTGAGCVRFDSGGSVQYVQFIDCIFGMRSETAGSNPKMIHIDSTFAIDRYVLFDGCTFYNFWDAHAGKLDYAIVGAGATAHDIILKDCMLVGVDAWANASVGSDSVWTNQANAESDGGKAVAVDVTA